MKKAMFNRLKLLSVYDRKVCRKHYMCMWNFLKIRRRKEDIFILFQKFDYFIIPSHNKHFPFLYDKWGVNIAYVFFCGLLGFFFTFSNSLHNWLLILFCRDIQYMKDAQSQTFHPADQDIVFWLIPWHLHLD